MPGSTSTSLDSSPAQAQSQGLCWAWTQRAGSQGLPQDPSTPQGLCWETSIRRVSCSGQMSTLHFFPEPRLKVASTWGMGRGTARAGRERKGGLWGSHGPDDPGRPCLEVTLPTARDTPPTAVKLRTPPLPHGHGLVSEGTESTGRPSRCRDHSLGVSEAVHLERVWGHTQPDIPGAYGDRASSAGGRRCLCWFPVAQTQREAAKPSSSDNEQAAA